MVYCLRSGKVCCPLALKSKKADKKADIEKLKLKRFANTSIAIQKIKPRKGHVPILPDIFMDVLSNLTVNDCDTLQLVNTRLNRIVNSRLSSPVAPIRTIHATLVTRSGTVILYYNQGGKKQRRFASVGKLLELRKQQNTLFRNVCISEKNMQWQQLLRQILNTESLKPGMPPFFTYYKISSTLVPELVTKARCDTSGLYCLQLSPEIFTSPTIECVLRAETMPRCALSILSMHDLMQWLEFNPCSDSPIPRRFKANVYKITESPKMLLQKMIERFFKSNRPMQWELIFMDIGKENHSFLRDAQNNQAIKNCSTGEVLESFVSTAACQVRGETADWILRRRSMAKEWTNSWPGLKGAEMKSTAERAFSEWIHLIRLADNAPVKKIRFI
ncbi:hypothetical protein Ddc_08276 [Ditylenchus destructor]|nr:hypothetical protein Ddc_08276 [Ditylenchus destructor]